MDVNATDNAGVITRGPRVTSKRCQNAVTVFAPFALALSGIASGVVPTWTTAGVFVVCFVLGPIGIGIGLHRYFAHRAFQAHPAVQVVLGILASWAWQGPVIQWVSDHRRHHRFADTGLDPHSPHFVRGRAARTTVGGLFHAHLGWMLSADVSDPRRFAVDAERDRVARFCSRWYWPLALSSLLVPAGLGGMLGGQEEALRCLVWAGALRIVLLQHLTWAIASAGHRYGEKRHDAQDEARNSVALALLLFGEGLHSFHHVYPGLGVNQPEHLDLNGQILQRWERWGWIRHLKRPEAAPSCSS
jgi:stearoyl-CoA desaturase (delta-9 desaturase)